jgi:hypothetical protein
MIILEPTIFAPPAQICTVLHVQKLLTQPFDLDSVLMRITSLTFKARNNNGKGRPQQYDIHYIYVT